MKIKPSARLSRRHLLVEGKKDEIEKAILDYIGILGWSKAMPVFLKKENKFILSVNRKSIDGIRAAFELSDKNIKILRVSGTLRGLDK